jgi:hypothetical protein
MSSHFCVKAGLILKRRNTPVSPCPSPFATIGRQRTDAILPVAWEGSSAMRCHWRSARR